MPLDQKTLVPLGVVAMVVAAIAGGAFVIGQTSVRLSDAEAKAARFEALNIAVRLASIEATLNAMARRQVSQSSSIRRRVNLGTAPE